MAFLEVDGFCPTCDQATSFSSEYDWLRDHFKCGHCGSIPRERALMLVIERYMPDWKERRIHESSPGPRGASVKLAQAPGYSGSQYHSALPPGAVTPSGYRNENLERLSFPDESFDLVVTQDVMEHVFEPGLVFAEIGRVLKPGGMHAFTTPLVNKNRPSERRARRLADGSVEHLAKPEYHGNPVDPNGSLVTFHWGYDVVHHAFRSSGLLSTIIFIDDLSHGIRAEYIEVIVTSKADQGQKSGIA